MDGDLAWGAEHTIQMMCCREENILVRKGIMRSEKLID